MGQSVGGRGASVVWVRVLVAELQVPLSVVWVRMLVAEVQVLYGSQCWWLRYKCCMGQCLRLRCKFESCWKQLVNTFTETHSMGGQGWLRAAIRTINLVHNIMLAGKVVRNKGRHAGESRDVTAEFY